MGEIHVESEFAPLRTVVLTQSEVAFGETMLHSRDMDFLPDPAPGRFGAGQDFRDADPVGQRAWEKERDAFRAVLERHGVEVLRPRMLTAAEKAAAGGDGYANFFVRDPFFTIGPVVVEGSLRFRHRRREVLPVRDIMRHRVMPSACTYVAVPMPEVAADDDASLGAGPFLEGGDVLVLGKTVFVGMSGLASNAAGAEWLAKLLRPQGYTVEPVRLRPNILHLDCALGLVRDGLMIVCEEALLDGIPEPLRAWDRIAVSLDEAMRLATNGLPISPGIYVADPAFATIGDALGRRGIAVEYVDYRISRSFGGAFRGSTQPLWRA
ncbi:dimethylarginine dimethylaminohydrolase family protein [Phreatobacter sp. AB_2022a]|uniref:dimethylarginine dimethylaminohydrolase family protein n=1 Tax=Phreatobacter sp. AB_2022a TaxID=3003134 RepID=UPI0022871A36|nr:arginine deiminase family protein [Phreatobacter sp. AB_2022a]MCZ0736159.1 arginine deiminase family protein [Phreatobacter sp. AB_2022a]